MAASASGEASPTVAMAVPRLALLVVDDCRLYREGLVAILAKEPEVARVYAAWDVPSLEITLEGACPDVVLVNLACADSITVITLVRTRSPASKIIAIGVGESDREIVECAETGVTGLLLRSEPFQHLTVLLRGVVAGDATCSPRASAALMRRVAQLADDRTTAESPVRLLTDREDQVFRFMDAGFSNQQIAEKLGIELHTVKNHVHHILVKLGVTRRGEAVAAMRTRPTSPGSRLLPSKA